MEDLSHMTQHYSEMTSKFQIDQDIVNSVVAQVQKWTAKGIKTYFFWSCFYGPVCEEEKKILTEEIKNTLVRRLQGAGAIFLNIPGTYTTFDGDHLGSLEALRFSKNLKEALIKN
ncbi:MAG TPA: hypothetical protein VNJ08_09805 [Bacteriovoracaceae bacterium]|nr:hypothetical protein [Bacteriovoracaceae bacterium]